MKTLVTRLGHIYESSERNIYILTQRDVTLTLDDKNYFVDGIEEILWVYSLQRRLGI